MQVSANLDPSSGISKRLILAAHILRAAGSWTVQGLGFGIATPISESGASPNLVVNIVPFVFSGFNANMIIMSTFEPAFGSPDRIQHIDRISDNQINIGMRNTAAAAWLDPVDGDHLDLEFYDLGSSSARSVSSVYTPTPGGQSIVFSAFGPDGVATDFELGDEITIDIYDRLLIAGCR
jgi:hypothetical protein